MKKLLALFGIVSIASAAFSAPTANEDFVVAEDARTYTNAVAAAKEYTDAAIAALPAPDYSTGNTQLVATIEATAPAPGNYAAVSNAAMTALHSETDPTVPAWAKGETPPLPPDYATVSNHAMTALQEHQPLTNYYTKSQVDTSLSAKANDNAVVKLTGNQEIEGVKTFKDNIVLYEEEPNVCWLKIYATYLETGGDGLIQNFLYLPYSSGTLALTSDIPNISGKADKADVAAAALAATNYTDEAIAAATNGLAPATPSEPCRVAARSWNRPSAFALAYDPILAENSTTFFDISTNAFGMVWSNVTATTAKGLAAKFFFDSLDPLSTEVAPLIQSLQVTGGGVAVDNVVTVPTAGVYRVTALTPGGEARTTRAAFSALKSKTTHGSYYVADANANRQAVNDYAATALAGMEPVRTGTDPGGNSYTIYSTCLPGFAAREGTGQFTPFAVAPKFAATAAHYPWVDAQNVTYTVDGQTFTIRRGAPCFTLYSWAVTNGFDEAELRAAAADDIEIVPLADGAQFPEFACPYFATPEWIAANYGSLDNLVAWTVTQRSEYGIPAVVTGGGDNLAYYWLSAGGLTPQVRPRTDLVSLIGEYNERGWWRVQVGDSGKPVWFVDQSSGTPRPILISHFKYVSGGPNYCAAARVLAALCQQYNTTFKLLQ